MSVTVFSSSSCAICHAEMDWLSKQGVNYNNIIVDEAEDGMAKMMEATGGIIQGTPFTVIDQDGKKETVAGFDRGRLQLLLGLS